MAGWSPTPPGLRRGRKKRAHALPVQLVGRDYLRILRPYLERLHAAYPHPNRVLFYDDVAITYLLAFFNPSVRSLRCIEDASQTEAINPFLNVEAVCRSTLSDANALFDPEHLQGLIAELRSQLPSTRGGPKSDAELAKLLDGAILVDGSFFRLAADVHWAIHAANQHGGGKGLPATPNAEPIPAEPIPAEPIPTEPIPLPPGKSQKLAKKKKPTPAADASGKPGIGTVRLNCQFCLRTGVPVGVSVNGSDGVHESTAARAFIEPGHLYLFDSGIVSFAYLGDVLNAASHLLCNLAKGTGFTLERENPLSQTDRDAGVLSDRTGRLSGSHGHAPPDAPLREIIVQYTDRTGQSRSLRLLTDLLDLPASVIAQLYRQRWQIELFFRWLKVNANFSHLCSHSKNGVSLAFHVTVIAAMLMVLRTGRPLSKYAYNLTSLVAAGFGDLPSILPILENRERERQLARERLARKKTSQKPA